MSTDSENMEQQNPVGVIQWDPQEALESCSSEEVLFSRGFLRCKPEKWFPGLGAQWLPLAHTFDRPFEVIGLKPTMKLPNITGLVSVALVDNEPLGLYIENTQKEVLLETILPKSHFVAKEVGADYLARRLLMTLVSSWSGPAVNDIEIDAPSEFDPALFAGAIEISVSFSDSQFELWLLLSRKHVEMLDGMWRRQTSSFKRIAGSSDLRIQIAELAVPEAMIAEYTRTGAIIDLEVPEKRTATLLRGDVPWHKIELARLENSFGMQVLEDANAESALPPGTVRLSIELGHFSGEPEHLAEFSQVGAMMASPVPLTNRIEVRAGGEIVAVGRLCLYQDRFAATID